MTPIRTTLTLSGMTLALLCGNAALAQEGAAKLADVLNLETTVSSEISPDLAVMVLAVDREGVDSAVLSREVNDILTRALAQAKTTPGIQASSGGYHSFARQDNKGKRIGWQLHAEIVLKSRDFGALGQLAGRLSNELVVSSSNFEISAELRLAEESRLIDVGAKAFRDKAAAAAKAFGYSGYRIREIQLGSAGQQPGPRPVLMRATARNGTESVPVPLESPRVALSLSVAGSVQLQR